MGGAAVAIELLLGLLDRATAISQLFAQAHKEGRDITDSELNAIIAADDAAKTELDRAIERRRILEANKKAAKKQE